MKLLYLIAILAVTLQAQPPLQPAPGAASPAGVTPETVIMSVDGKDVTAGELRKALEIAGPQFIQLFQQNPTLAIQNLYINQYLSAEGERLKLQERSPLKEQIEFQRKWAIATAMVNQEQNGYQVPPQDVQKYYEEHQDEFASARVKAITIGFKATVQAKGTTPDDLKAVAQDALNAAHAKHTEEEALKIAEEVLKKAKAGADFEKLMAEYSEDDLSKSGESFPVTTTGATPEAFKKAVLALKQPGDLTGVIRTPGFFHIGRLEKRSVQPLDDVSTQILLALRNQHFRTWFEALQKRYVPVIKNQEFFSRPGLPPAAAAGPSKP